MTFKHFLKMNVDIDSFCTNVSVYVRAFQCPGAVTRDVFRTQPNIYDGAFCKIS